MEVKTVREKVRADRRGADWNKIAFLMGAPRDIEGDGRFNRFMWAHPEYDTGLNTRRFKD